MNLPLRSLLPVPALLLALHLAWLLAVPNAAWCQKYGGILKTMTRANPVGLSPHETASADTTWVMSPVYGNLVWFDHFIPRETPDTIRPELAESWQWNAERTALTFRLRPGVRFHDGHPFTGADVKHTFDTVRGRGKYRLKLNPSKLLYFNVEEIVTDGDHAVTFRLKRPQPSLLTMLAGGRSPIYAAHVDPNRMRTTALGTGPFRLKEFSPDKRLVMEKNPDFFVKGRPYLDGIEYAIIKDKATQNAALQAKQIDAGYPSHTTRPDYENLKAANVGLQFIEMVSNGTSNIIINTQKPPFNNLRLRQAVNLALQRASFAKTVYQGGSAAGSAMVPAPFGAWGLTKEQLARLPGYGDREEGRARARELLAAEGYGPGKPLRVKVSTRNLVNYTKPAAWVAGELKAVGIEAEIEHIDTGLWYSTVARRVFQLGVNATAVPVDDPDAQFYENFKCYSERNYSDYCNPEVEKLYDRQSVEPDFEKRRQLVQQIDIRLQEDVARPYLGYNMYYYGHYPHVKNWVPHSSSYNCWRMSEVWLER